MTAALQSVAAPSPVSAVDLLDIASPTVNPAPRATREGSRTVIWLDGDNDLATLPTLAATLSRVTDDVADDVIVDLSGVTFISATTLGELIRCRNDLRDRSRNLTLRFPSGCARRVLEVCQLTVLVERESALSG